MWAPMRVARCNTKRAMRTQIGLSGERRNLRRKEIGMHLHVERNAEVPSDEETNEARFEWILH